ncbi:MAG: late competence development ComFB family protein [Spirochaetaceae bacterium]|jgi:competence protein ComFB|nr:late competence development ComFB family protein [Spirochaetaceae bacterium]
MTALDQYDFENLKNESETHVFNELAAQLEAVPQEVCRCNDCIGDMAAIALNRVVPKYRWSLLGGLYTASAMNDEKYRTSVEKAVREAIAIVRNNPSHDQT